MLFKHGFHHLVGKQVSLRGVFFQVHPVQLFVDAAPADDAMHVRVKTQLLTPCPVTNMLPLLHELVLYLCFVRLKRQSALHWLHFRFKKQN